MSAIEDLRLALRNMSERADGIDLDDARKNLRRSRDIAIRYVKVNPEVAKQIILIITDAQQLVSKSPSIQNYLRYVAQECLLTIDPTSVQESEPDETVCDQAEITQDEQEQ